MNSLKTAECAAPAVAEAAHSALRTDGFGQGLGGVQAFLAADIEMGDGAHDMPAKGRDQNIGRAGAGDNALRLLFGAKDHDVGLDRLEIEPDAGERCEALGEDARIGVILGKPVKSVVERIKTGSRKNTRLAHRSAKHAPRPRCARDVGATSGQEAADRAAQPF